MRPLRALLSLCAAATVVAACAASPDRRPKENSFDTDNDGYLTPEEYSASKLSEVLDFEALDKDQDGLLSEAELRFGGAKGGSGSRGKGGPRGERRS